VRREQFDHIIRAAAAITGDDVVTVIGSQAILGSWPDQDLPAALLSSQEVDLIPAADLQEKRDLIDGSIGEFSQFHEVFGVWAHGVAATTAVLPPGWSDRLVHYASPGTRGAVALCLDPHDLWIAKAIRSDARDIAYCRALASSGRLTLSIILERLAATPAESERLDRARTLAATSFGAAAAEP
jgi:hypothetical protein